jgi:hypothetical protein
MKKSILVPLFLGLVLAGCSRNSTNANKVSSNDPNKPIYDSQSATAKSEAAKQAEIAAANSTTPTPPAPEATVATTPAPTPATTEVAATPAPTPTPAPTEVAATTPPPVTTPTTEPALEVPKTTTETATAAAAKTDGTPTAPTDLASDKNESRAATTDVAARISEWKLAPDEIRSEQEAGRIVRSKTVGAGEPTGPMDDVLVDQVKGKLQSDATTGQLKFDVKSEKGVVTLQGSAHTLDQIGTAIALALDTPGVTQIISEVKIESKSQP